jgi:hypothetical protein
VPGEERAASRAALEEEEAVNQEREHGPELRSTFAGVNTYTTGDICTAGNAFTARNTDATPPTGRPRLHRRPNVSTTTATLSLSSLLELCSVLRRRRWGAPSCRLAWLPAFEPQDCRVAFVWSSRATHAPGPADAMRGPFVDAGLRAKRAVQECCAPPCRLAARSGYQTTAPGEQARTCERHARLGPARVRRAPCWATGQPSRQGRRRGALSSRGIPDPYSPPTRVARLFEPGFDPCVFAGVRRGAAP